jgi:hypothetical protein
VQYQKEPKKIAPYFFKKKITPLALIKRLEICKRKVKSVFKRQNKGRLPNSSNLSDHRQTVSTAAMTKQVRGRIQQKLLISSSVRQSLRKESSIVKED